jgi:TolB-like protein/class 3 adenylate cyclase/tetratricopeptide (TPR) repeat protein
MERRLAAVLIADVVGYGRLSHADEEGTRVHFQADLKHIFEPRIAEHHGRLVKTMGDGILAEFGSVVHALRCAVDIQRAKTDANTDLALDRRLEFRIAINLGDVIVEGEDIHGTGVNIADRLQTLAKPGGVVISGTAYDQVANKLDVGYEFLGEQRVKNIPEPVRVYSVLTDLTAVTPAVAPIKLARRQWRWQWVAIAAGLLLLAAGAAFWQHPWVHETPEVASVTETRPSLVVLPFDSLSDDKERGYLADGITEDLTTELARVPGLFVVSRNAAFTYKGKSMQPAQVARELGVRYVVEGSIRRAGAEMRINAQLIDATTNGYLWAERFDGAWAEVFNLQDKIVGNIATTLKLRLVSGQRDALMAGGTSNPAAYEAFLRGLELEYRDTPEDVAAAVTHFEHALALDPDFGRASAELAWVYWNAWGLGRWEEALGLFGSDAPEKLTHYLEEAAKHPSPTYYQILAELLVRQYKSDDAIAAIEKAIALDSSDPSNYAEMSAAMTFNGRAAEGRGYVDAAMRVEPGWTTWRYYLAGLAYFSMDRFEDAIASLEKINPKSRGLWLNFYGLIVRLSACGQLGRVGDIAVVKETLKPISIEIDEGELTGLLARNNFVFKNEADTKRLLDGLRKAGVPELPFGYDAKSKDRLTGEEIKSLTFGHEIRGTRLNGGVVFSRTTAEDGTTRGFGCGPSLGTSTIRGDTLCTMYLGSQRSCAAVFRNPNGSFAHENDYLLIGQYNRCEFSVVK